jgi:Cu/Ag efflux pump CusA
MGAMCGSPCALTSYAFTAPYSPLSLLPLYQLNAVPGVAEVASGGGGVRQYQIDLDPHRLRTFGIPLSTVVDAVMRSNRNEVMVVTLVNIAFLLNVRSVLNVTLPLPLAVLTAFLFMRYLGITSNIMSLAGIAIAIGVLVDAAIQQFPEVASVVAKIARAETSTDPAPVNPEAAWRPEMTREHLIRELDAAATLPGVSNIWTQPIIKRINMLATGIRSEVGVKVFGNDLKILEEWARAVADELRKIPGAVDVYPEQVTGASYLDFPVNREAAARYGIAVGAIHDVNETAVGEMNLTLTIGVSLMVSILIGSATLMGGQMPMGGQSGQPEQPTGEQPIMGRSMMGMPMMGGVMCPMMSGMMGGQTDPSGMMGMMSGGQTDPKAMARMLALRGGLLKAMGEVMLSHAKLIAEGK